MRRVPGPLLVILCVAAVQSIAWSVLLPVFQGPDEREHFSYAQRIAEERKPTWSALETLRDGTGLSNEIAVVQKLGSFAPLAGNFGMRPYGTEIDEARWRAADARLTDADQAATTFTPAFRNPPAYYLYEAVAYAPFSGADVITRQYALRWATIPFFLVTVLMAWLLAGEVFGRRRWLQAVAALFVALQPLLAQLGGIVNPDAMIAAVFGVGLWLSAVIVNRGLTRLRALGAVATALGALAVHPRAAPVLVVLATAVAVRVWRAQRADRGRRLAAGATIAGGAVLFVAANVWYAVRGDLSSHSLREFASYLWQFYLPRPDFLTPAPGEDHDVRDVLVDRLWSGYLSFEVSLPPGILDAVWIATLAGAVIVLVTLIHRRAAVRAHLGLAVVFGVAVLSLFIVLHSAAWRDLQIDGNPIITGRYLTPLLPIAGVAIAAVAASLPRRIGPAAATAVLGLEVLLALGAFGATVVRFHA